MDFAELIPFLAQQPLLLIALAAILIAALGQMLARSFPMVGRFLRSAGNLGLFAALLLTIVQAARMNSNSDFSLALAGMKEQVVEGGETRVPMDADNHFWVNATVNGVKARFLVDTGATVTALSDDTARAAGIEPSRLGRTIILRTANGEAQAKMASVEQLQFGNVDARDLDVVITPGLGDTNVIGMNLLSRLGSWRVEGRTLILVPKGDSAGAP